MYTADRFIVTVMVCRADKELAWCVAEFGSASLTGGGSCLLNDIRLVIEVK